LLVTPLQQMVFFTLLSFLALGAGAIAISVLTVVGRGNRSFAFIMSISATALGLFMYFQLDSSGWMPTFLGAVAIIVACIPARKRERYDEDAELDRQGF
jgi:magnesium-transporting ATPase (P-type)